MWPRRQRYSGPPRARTRIAVVWGCESNTVLCQVGERVARVGAPLATGGGAAATVPAQPGRPLLRTAAGVGGACRNRSAVGGGRSLSSGFHAGNARGRAARSGWRSGRSRCWRARCRCSTREAAWRSVKTSTGRKHCPCRSKSKPLSASFAAVLLVPSCMVWRWCPRSCSAPDRPHTHSLCAVRRGRARRDQRGAMAIRSR